MESINPTDAHLVKVWGVIEKMTPGKRIVIAEVAPKFPALWIKCAKMFIDCFGCNIVEFNNDYSILRKI